MYSNKGLTDTIYWDDPINTLGFLNEMKRKNCSLTQKGFVLFERASYNHYVLKLMSSNVYHDFVDNSVLDQSNFSLRFHTLRPISHE